MISKPQIKTPLPGPKAKAVIERDTRSVSPSYTRGYPLVIAQGKGAMVEDVDGNWFLDCAAGIATNSTGHSHPDVVKAITEQAQRYLHMSGTDFYYDLQVTLAEALERIVPIAGATKSFFGNSGAEANEAALKLSRYHSKRSFVIAFFGSFHGRTMGALGLTASKAVQRAGFGPTTTPGVFHALYPDPYRHPRGPEAAVDECFEYLEDRLFAQLVPADEVAAIVVEPIQGEGGYIVPPAAFFQRLQELARKHGILIVADEVQSGMGRTGRMFACEHFGLEPDMVTMAKGIASGMPLGVATGRAALWNWTPGAHASTFGGNPVSCAAALATIRLLENGLIDNAARVGQYLLDGLRALQEKHLLIGDVRGRGLMIGVELVRDRQTKERAIEERDQVVQEVFTRGVLLLGAGRNVIRFSPPLLLTTDQADMALAALDEALGAVGGVRGQVATARS